MERGAVHDDVGISIGIDGGLRLGSNSFEQTNLPESMQSETVGGFKVVLWEWFLNLFQPRRISIHNVTVQFVPTDCVLARC
jgi:hypothetical protein